MIAWAITSPMPGSVSSSVALAVFTAFPMFGKLQVALQAWLVQALIPDSIARQVLGYLNQFAGKASRLGA